MLEFDLDVEKNAALKTLEETIVKVSIYQGTFLLVKVRETLLYIKKT